MEIFYFEFVSYFTLNGDDFVQQMENNLFSFSKTTQTDTLTGCTYECYTCQPIMLEKGEKMLEHTSQESRLTLIDHSSGVEMISEGSTEHLRKYRMTSYI